MNRNQLTQIIDYIDAEFAGIVSRMSQEERSSRLKHFSREIGALDFDQAMTAVRKLSRGQYMPRTAEILAEVEQMNRTAQTGKETVRIFKDHAGHEIVDVRVNGETTITGYLSGFPEWMQAKFRWQATGDPTELDTWILGHEGRDGLAGSGIFPEVDALMTMVGGAA